MENAKTLMAYASRYGSTQEVAETIAAELRLAGLEVEAGAMSDIGTLDLYQAVVLGAAIYNAKWHADAHLFLRRHQAALRQRLVAIFALGPLSTDAAAMIRSRRQLDKELAQYAWLKPVALDIFVGKVDPSRLGFFDRLGITASDHRDWDAVRAWARALAVRLPQVLAQPTAA